MAQILCAWEFGSGLGHLTRLLPIARRLHDAGHDIVLAVPNPEGARPVLDKHFPAAQGPFRLKVIAGTQWQIPQDDPELRTRPTHVLADVLTLFNYHDPKQLGQQTGVWQRIIKQYAPALILADFAPTLRLAHGDSTVPFVMTGNGYTMPPPGRVLPPIKPWQEGLYPFSRRNEAEVLRAMNMVRDGLRCSAVDHVGDMLNGDESFVCTIPEFDPYQRFRQQPVLVPFNVPLIERFSPVEARSETDAVFIYLPANHPQLKAVLGMAAALPYKVHVYVSGLPPEAVARLAGRNTSVHRKPLNFETELARFRLIIHHAGLATAYAAIRAGTPQLLLPVNLEHMITSHGARDMAGAEVIPARPDSKDDAELIGKIREAALHLLQDRDLWQRVHDAARLVAKRPVTDGVGIIADACLARIEQAKSAQAAALPDDIDVIA